MLYEMISGFIYAMPCIVFVCVSFSFFTSAPCALLRFIEERDPLRVKSKAVKDRKSRPSRVRANY